MIFHQVGENLFGLFRTACQHFNPSHPEVCFQIVRVGNLYFAILASRFSVFADIFLIARPCEQRLFRILLQRLLSGDEFRTQLFLLGLAV